jgi:hypothetical protein
MNNVQDTNSEPRALDIDDAADAILGRWDDGESLSELEDKDATSEDQNETEVDEDELDDDDVDADSDEDLEDPDGDETEDTDEDDDEAEEDDDDEDKEPLTASDDQIVDIAVNGETKKVSVKDLKRLYGQEASLTKKSQDLAAQRKASDDSLAQTHLSYQKLMERAEARYKPYADIDMLVASRQMDPETFAQLRQDAKQAEDDLTFLKEESGQLVSKAQQENQQLTKQAAAEFVKVLEEQLPDWGNELYGEIRTYAVKAGLPQEQVDQYTSPEVIMLINKARLYDQSKQSAEGKKAKAKLTKSKNGKTKVLSSKKSPPSNKSIQAKRKQQAMSGLSGAKDLDDIADALMSRWES